VKKLHIVFLREKKNFVFTILLLKKNFLKNLRTSAIIVNYSAKKNNNNNKSICEL
jgi:hypothetical protein